jgi:hypothetical protein
VAVTNRSAELWDRVAPIVADARNISITRTPRVNIRPIV